MKNADKPAFGGNLEIDNQRFLRQDKVDIVDAYHKILREVGTKNDGLSKREYFAGLAMQGILSEGRIEGLQGQERFDKMTVGKAIAIISIEYADELLKQLGE